MHFVLSAIWNYKNLCSYFPLFIVFVALMIQASFLTITAVCFRLNAENYEWQWMSFVAPFGVAFFIFGYCAYYFLKYVTYGGVTQVVYFFASSLFIALMVGVVCGFVGFVSSYQFVRILYNNMKID